MLLINKNGNLKKKEKQIILKLVNYHILLFLLIYKVVQISIKYKNLDYKF